MLLKRPRKQTLADKQAEILWGFQQEDRKQLQQEIPARFWYYEDGYTYGHKKAEDDDGSCCCFNHYIGLPVKDGKEHPIYQYEMDFSDLIDECKLIHNNKATGLGITEIMLRKMLHMGLTNPEIIGNQMAIITGPRERLAKEMIKKRLNEIIRKKHPELIRDIKDTELTLSTGTVINSYPSMNIDAMRGQPKLKFIFGDETAFFGMLYDDIVRQVAERYIPKSNPWIVWVSTPGPVRGFFYEIDQMEPESQYRKFPLSYLVSYGLLLDKEEIEKQKKVNRYFEVEYNNQYLRGRMAAIGQALLAGRDEQEYGFDI